MQRLTPILSFFILNTFFICILVKGSNNRLKDVYNEAFKIVVKRGDVKKLIDLYKLDYVTVEEEMSCDSKEKRNLRLKTGRTVEETIKENENDVLSRILKNKEVRIGTVRNKNWGKIGNYTVDEPTGFWPSLMRMVWAEISDNYFGDRNAITVSFKTYNNVFNALQLKNIDMTENFFLLLDNPGEEKLLRNEKHIVNGEPVINHTNKFILLNKHEIHDFPSFEKFLNKKKKSKIGCLTKANCDILKNKFSDKVEFVAGRFSSYNDLITSVEEEKLTAAVVSGLDMSIFDQSKFNVIESPIRTVHAPYFNSAAYGMYFNHIIVLGLFVFTAISFWF